MMMREEDPTGLDNSRRPPVDASDDEHRQEEQLDDSHDLDDDDDNEGGLLLHDDAREDDLPPMSKLEAVLRDFVAEHALESKKDFDSGAELTNGGGVAVVLV
jgi:hypothetical protein